MPLTARQRAPQPEAQGERIYRLLKQEIFDFLLLPGDRFSENDIAARMGASRTPVRQALQRLAQEGYLDVQPRSGWQVRPIDFDHLEALYDLRVVLETEAVTRLCALPARVTPLPLVQLREFWIDAPPLAEGCDVAPFDEAFHMTLVGAVGNPEMARVHLEVTEKIRIVRRMDFTQAARISATYAEHGQILLAVLERNAQEARTRLHDHIAQSQKEVRKITLHALHQAGRKTRD
ncbi:GntR family transcriptional regulator [Cronobacter dublinensis]|uniref:GntR family transcriptional regulator n=1 Tax=Cronobacter dublinensis TaxID=413497 RepID=UPI00029C6F81|nr:GntR family transcriptional regulator [Cronobacter dublinensis]CCJ84598.1 Transcriptional regulator, GntR family [Cronobacter dublinensis 582]EKY3088718.1 GntR family transcriptional regulator [Cronobacter dublinensis]ELQ5995025.1 GntR family transcriptional regulator [Cronobacter dublinensis]ELQ6215269.1 GntR family transcriptional regulator [Cronobacter dublinensis]ELQ6229847.1 GntR family transcriptional regulator [Cronobacter dublinensis]